MRKPRLCGSVLLAVLLASVALARERDTLAVRPILLSEHPDDTTHRVYVKGQVTTVLRFEQPVDPSRTEMMGWKGRLEPLAVVRNKVVLEPLHDLAPDEGIPLVVTLSDGTEVAFLLRPSGRGGGALTDQQVNVFTARESYEALHSALRRALKENEALREENERRRQEETSTDHALAALLAAGAIELTPFRPDRKWLLPCDGCDAKVEVQSYVGSKKTAIVMRVTNRDPNRQWNFSEARLMTASTYERRQFALKRDRDDIAPGMTGTIAVVADDSAYQSKDGPQQLVLELFRSDGMQQVQVVLEQQVSRR